MEESEIRKTTQKILRSKNENEVLKNLKRFGDFLAENSVVACEFVTDIIYAQEPDKADIRFIQFTAGYMARTSLRMEKAVADLGIAQ